MSLNKIFSGLKNLNDAEKLKSFVGVRKILAEVQQLGLKKFWEMNNKVFYLILKILIVIIIYSTIRNSRIVTLFRTDLEWSLVYFAGTMLIFITTIGYAINFYLKIGIKQDFNTDEIMRKQMKYKGVDWHKHQELLKKEEE